MFGFKSRDPVKMKAASERLLTNLSWEADVVLNERRSKKTAWIVASFAVFVATILGISISFILPLKKVVPYVVVVDKITGEGSVVQTGKEAVTLNDMTEKHWLNSFVVARERYMYRFLQFDYDTVRLLSGDRVWINFKSIYEGATSLDQVLKDNVEIIPLILSTTLNGNGTATVRYELKTRDYRNASPAVVVRRIATIRYEFQTKNFEIEKDAIANPLGFTVQAYQTDPESSEAKVVQ